MSSSLGPDVDALQGSLNSEFSYFVSIRGSLPLEAPALGDLQQHICHAENSMGS